MGQGFAQSHHLANARPESDPLVRVPYPSPNGRPRAPDPGLRSRSLRGSVVRWRQPLEGLGNEPHFRGREQADARALGAGQNDGRQIVGKIEVRVRVAPPDRQRGQFRVELEIRVGTDRAGDLSDSATKPRRQLDASVLRSSRTAPIGIEEIVGGRRTRVQGVYWPRTCEALHRAARSRWQGTARESGE